MLAGFVQDDWRVRNNMTLNIGLRYDVEIIKDIPDWPASTDKDNLDPRIGFAWDPRGDQKWAIRGGFGGFTQQHAIFTIVKGGVGGRNGLVTLSLNSTDPLFPTFPTGRPARTRTTSTRESGLPGIPGAIRSGPSVAALAASRSSMQFSPSSRAASAAATVW